MIYLTEYDSVTVGSCAWGYNTTLDHDSVFGWTVKATASALRTRQSRESLYPNSGRDVAGYVDATRLGTTWESHGFMVSMVVTPGYEHSEGLVDLTIVKILDSTRNYNWSDLTRWMTNAVVTEIFEESCNDSDEQRARDFVANLRDRAANLAGTDALDVANFAVLHLATQRADELVAAGNFAAIVAYM